MKWPWVFKTMGKEELFPFILMVYKSVWQANTYIEEINMRSVSEDDTRAD